MANRVRNGKLEIYRFLFAMYVLLFHYEKYFMGEPSLKNGIFVALCPHGSIGVEFFFLLSGFFMAKSIYNLREKQSPAMRNTVNPLDGLAFMWKKYIAIFPQHVVAFILCFIAYVWYNGFAFPTMLLKLVDSIPNFFLIQMSGMNFTNPNHVEWYLSCMLLAMFILYPFCKKYYHMLYKYITPILTIMVVGYCVQTTGALTGVATWVGVTYKSMIRAVIELLLGGTTYELSKWIKERAEEHPNHMKICCTVIEIASLLCVSVFVFITAPKKYEAYALFLLFVLIAVAGSGVSFSPKVFHTKICLFLGQISLPIYLSQVAAIWIGMKLGWEGIAPLPIFLAMQIILTVLVYFGGKLLSKAKIFHLYWTGV